MPTLGSAYFFMIAYIDESGDTGWKFDKPYRLGGSSRYLTISALLVPNILKHHPKRIIRDFYKKYSIPTAKEIKGADLLPDQKLFFTNQVIHLLQTHQEIKIRSITVNKQNVQEHIRGDGNKIYNYMIGLLLLDEIANEDKVTLMPDPRSIKVKSGNSLLDYLQIKLWFDLSSKTILDISSIPSDKCDNLKFIDIVTHIIWCRFENNDATYLKMLNPYIKYKSLFF